MTTKDKQICCQLWCVVFTGVSMLFQRICSICCYCFENRNQYSNTLLFPRLFRHKNIWYYRSLFLTSPGLYLARGINNFQKECTRADFSGNVRSLEEFREFMELFISDSSLSIWPLEFSYDYSNALFKWSGQEFFLPKKRASKEFFHFRS